MKHNIAKLLLANLLIATLFFTGCKEDDGEKEVVDTDKNTGFVLVTADANGDYFVNHYDELPSGDIDATTGKSFQSFLIETQYKNALFGMKTDGTYNNISKFTIDETGEIVETTIPTIGSTWNSLIVQDGIGFYQDKNEKAVTRFDPETMEITATVDLSSAYWYNDLADNEELRNPIIRGDYLFYRHRASKNSVDLDSLFYHVINLNTNSWEKDIFLAGAQGAFSDKNHIDESGNIYIGTAVNRTEPDIKPAIVKIPAGATDFDKDYIYNFIDEVEASEQLLQLFGGFMYAENGVGYALASVEMSPGILTLIAAKPELSDWTSDDFNQALYYLSTEPNAKWVKIDLESKSSEVIDGLPVTGLFNCYSMSKVGSKMYLGISNTEEESMYEYDPTGETSQQFKINKGGIIKGFYDLSQVD